MKRKNLSDVVQPSAIFREAFSHPVMKISPRTKVMPDIDDAMKCVLNAIENVVIETMAADMEGKMNDAYEMYYMINGERKKAVSGLSDWDSGMDGVVEDLCEEYSECLSQDWLGRNTLDTAMHEEGAVKKFCLKFGQEYYKNVTRYLGDDDEGTNSGPMTPARIMSSAGIVKSQIEEKLQEHIQVVKNQTQEEKTMAEEIEKSELEEVIAKIAAHVGEGYDVFTVAGDLDLASDDNEILANGAAPRLGLNAADLEVLQGERLLHGAATPTILEGMLERAFSTPVAAKPAKPKGRPKKTPPPYVALADKKEEAEGLAPHEVDWTVVLEALKTCSAKDEDMANGLGLSRATYNNYATGKVEFVPKAQQGNFVRAQVVSRLNKLLSALGEIDGNVPEPVF